MSRTTIILLFFFTFIISLRAYNNKCSLDKLYYGQISQTEDSLPSKVVEFYLSLSIQNGKKIYYRDVEDSKFTQNIIIAEKGLKADSLLFVYNNITFALDTNYRARIQKVSLSKRIFKEDKQFEYTEYGLYNITLLSTDTSEIRETIEVIENQTFKPKFFEVNDNFWGELSYLPLMSSVLFQGNIFQHFSLKKGKYSPAFSFNWPRFSIAKNEDGKTMISYQTIAWPALGFLNIIVFMIDYDTSILTGKYTLLPPILISMLSNPGIDMPIISERDYVSLFAKLNWDLYFWSDNDKEREGTKKFYLEPKIGLRYLHAGKIGIEGFITYRFWNSPFTFSDKNASFGVSLLLPMGRI